MDRITEVAAEVWQPFPPEALAGPEGLVAEAQEIRGEIQATMQTPQIPQQHLGLQIQEAEVEPVGPSIITEVNGIQIMVEQEDLALF